MSDNNIDIIFFRAWRNIVINRVIFKYVELYKMNKSVEFDLETLKGYGEREYIAKLICKSPNKRYGTLNKGDLPENGVLKEVDLSNYYQGQFTSVGVIPEGVEIIHFNCYHAILLSWLPSSIHTILNIKLKKPYKDNQIPNNITSLSFNNSLDPLEFYDIKLPNTIKILDLSGLSSIYKGLPNKSLPTTTFIPSSVTDLSTVYTEEEEYKHRLPTIPSSVTKLQLFIDGDGNKDLSKDLEKKKPSLQDSRHTLFKMGADEEVIDDFTGWQRHKKPRCSDVTTEYSVPSSVTKLQLNTKGYYQLNQGLVPFGVKELTILTKDVLLRDLLLKDARTMLLRFGVSQDVIDGLNRWDCIKLVLEKSSDIGSTGIIISKYSLPSSLTKLSIECGVQEQSHGVNIDIKDNSIPNSVTDLNLQFTNYPKSFNNIFPNSLTRLSLNNIGSDNTYPQLPELPTSIKYLKLNGIEIDIPPQIK